MIGTLVLPWSQILFGSLVGPAAGIAALWLARERDRRILTISGLSVCAGTWLWNSMLNVRHANVIDGDIPFRPFPISWQDTGTAVFSFATLTLILLATTGRDQPGHRTLKTAGIASIAALLMDIYTW
jgi:hypothetical protein